MNYIRYYVLVVAVLICAGCMSSAALVTYPESLKLRSEPLRYYELSIDLSVEGAPYHIDYSWACEQQKVFTASKMKWVLRWKSERKLVARQVEDGKIFYFMQPDYCGTDTANLVPQILMTNGEAKPTSAIYFDIRYAPEISKAVSEIVTRAVARKVPAPSTLGKMTAEEADMAASMSNRLSSYVSREVSVASAEAWQVNKELVKLFSTLTKTTRAIDILPAKFSGTFFKFGAVIKPAKGWKLPEPVRRYDPVFRKGQLVLDGKLVETKGKIFHLESGDACKDSVEFCYLGQCLPVKGIVNEIYYPATRELVSVSCRTLQYAFSSS